MVLDFLHQRQALRAGVVLDGEIHQQILRDGVLDEVFEFLGVDFQVLGLRLPPINHGGNAPRLHEVFWPRPGEPKDRGIAFSGTDFISIKILPAPAPA